MGGQKATASYPPLPRKRWADAGRSFAAISIFLARARSPEFMRIARPQSEVRLLGTGIRRMGTPPLLRCFSADRTWCVPLNIRMISLGERRPNGKPPESAVRIGRILYSYWMIAAGNIFGTQPELTTMAWIGAFALVVNLPLGYLREGTRKLSLLWFIYVHLSVPIIAYLRITNHVSAWAIPPFVACALIGQIAGGRMRRTRQDRT